MTAQTLHKRVYLSTRIDYCRFVRLLTYYNIRVDAKTPYTMAYDFVIFRLKLIFEM